MRTLQLLPFCGAVLVACSSSSGPGVMSNTSKGDAGVSESGAAKRDGGSHDAAHDAGHDAVRDAARDGAHDAVGDVAVAYPAPRPPMPQELNLGGPVMTSPKFVVITFAGDALAASIDDFVDKVAASADYWSGTTAEYGVGPVASVLHVSLNETPSASLADSDVQAWLTTKLSGPDAGQLEGGAPWPQPDGETVYMIYYPANVTISEQAGVSCTDFYGYHNDYAITGSTFVTYSVVARCPAFPDTSLIDSIASIASHELIEATTDPLPNDNAAWAIPDADHTAWAVPAGGELGDLCAGFGDVFYKPSDVPYLVQRTWSNKAAAAGHDPCQPNGATPYFNAAAVLTQSVTVNDPTLGTYTTKGIKIPVGGTGTIELDLYSDAPTSAPWTIQVSDFASLFGGAPDLDLSFGGKPTATGTNGDKLELTVKVLQQGTGGAELLWIQSTLGQTQPVWIGVVGN